MENCLKTTLKIEVQNDNLKVLGTVTFKVKAKNGDTNGRFRASEPVTYKFSSAVTVGGNSVTEASGIDITVTFPNEQEITVIASNKYKITHIIFSSHNVELTLDDAPEYLTSLKAIDTRNAVFTKFDGILEKCKFDSTLSLFALRNAKLVTGNIGTFKTYTNLTVLGIYSDYDVDKIDVVGDISQLSTLTKLIVLYITGTKITGNVEDLLDAIAPSRENGSTLEIKTNSLVYYNGTQSVRTINITFDGQGGWS